MVAIYISMGVSVKLCLTLSEEKLYCELLWTWRRGEYFDLNYRK
jgi:hypothetical protein